MEYGVIFLFVVILVVAITVGISRWVFRINDIVDRLDEIIDLLENKKKKG